MNKCILCGRPLNQGLSLNFLLSLRAYRTPVICPECKNQFERISDKHRCKDCNRAGDFKNELCSDCQRWRRITGHPFQNHSLYQYNSMMSEYMRRYKFQGDYQLRKVFQDELSQFVSRFNRKAVPIPIHQNTYQRRGFNQVKGLLKDVDILNVLTTRSNQKEVPQSRKTKVDRLHLPQPFKIKTKFSKLIKHQNLTVVDDVYTTGTTIRHATELLRNNGASSIISVTLAR